MLRSTLMALEVSCAADLAGNANGRVGLGLTSQVHNLIGTSRGQNWIICATDQER